MVSPPLLNLQSITLTLGGKPLLKGVDLSVGRGERLALVGRNGSGKSTLLKIAAGFVEADAGVRFVQPSARVRYLPQEPDLTGFETVQAYVEAALGPSDNPYKVPYLLEELGVKANADPRFLSGGETRRAALARVLAPEPDVLLLDEPTNHLDLPAIEWLERELMSLRSALVVISHDRRFLEDLSKITVWLDRGKTRRIEQGFKGFESWRDAILEEELRDAHKLDRRIEEEENWVRYGVTARRKRNQGRMGRLQQLRQQRRDAAKPISTVKLELSEARSSGKLVLEATNITKSFEQRAIVQDFSLRVLRGDRIGIVGANGAGKTTLVKLLTGELTPDSGEVRLGAGLEMAHLDQRRASLIEGQSLKDNLTGGGGDWVEINGQRKHVIGYMQDFLFRPEQARTPVDKLSGGERSRLTLARALSLPSNFLVLDEPTNDLDLETLDLLQEMLADYPGTLLLVSHDRDFLDRVANSIIVAEGNGLWQEYAGGYSDMIAQRGTTIETPTGPLPPTLKSTPKSEKPFSPSSKAKLSFKQKFRLQHLPQEIEKLQVQRQKLQVALADPDLYQKNPAHFTKISETLSLLESQLHTAEEEWLALEILTEG